MEEFKHWTVLIKERAEHAESCQICKVYSGVECVEYIILTQQIKMAFNRWLNN